MATYVTSVVAGAQSAPQYVTPTTSVAYGPATLGGTAVLEMAPTINGPWNTVASVTANASFRFPANKDGYVRLTATTQAANLVLSEMSGANSPLTNGVLVSSNVPFATPNSTAIQQLFGFRLPARFLPVNWRIEIAGSLSLSNNANVKTLGLLVNGTGGTSVGSYAVTSLATVNFYGVISGGDGANIKGYIGSAAGMGWAGSTTAVSTSTLARNYQEYETEIVVALTKATGTDTGELHSIRAVLYT